MKRLATTLSFAAAVALSATGIASAADALGASAWSHQSGSAAWSHEAGFAAWSERGGRPRIERGSYRIRVGSRAAAWD